MPPDIFRSIDRGDSFLIEVEGELDVQSAAELDGLIADAAKRDGPIVLSLLPCTYCDSRGLFVILKASREFEERFSVIVPEDGACRRIFEVSGIMALPFVRTNVGD